MPREEEEEEKERMEEEETEEDDTNAPVVASFIDACILHTASPLVDCKRDENAAARRATVRMTRCMAR